MHWYPLVAFDSRQMVVVVPLNDHCFLCSIPGQNVSCCLDFTILENIWLNVTLHFILFLSLLQKLFLVSEYEVAALKTQTSLSALNLGQNIIFSAALSTAMIMCSYGILDGTMSIGDLVCTVTCRCYVLYTNQGTLPEDLLFFSPCQILSASNDNIRLTSAILHTLCSHLLNTSFNSWCLPC